MHRSQPSLVDATIQINTRIVMTQISTTTPKAVLQIRNAGLLDNDGTFDIDIRNGVIARLEPASGALSDDGIDAAGGLVTQSYVDTHFHLDKVLSRDHFGALSPEEAFAHARDVKTKFSVADVTDRASRALEMAVAQGIGKMRAQVDVDFATKLVSLEGILQAREIFKDFIDIEIVAFPQEGIVTDPEAPALLREAISMGADLLGGLPEFERSVEDQAIHVNTILDIAEQGGVGVDMHCDYMDRPELKTLELIAGLTIERGLQGQVAVNHCNALATYPDEEAKRVIDKVVAANIDVSVLPVANLQMLGGTGRTPMNRASSRIKELLDAGVNVAAGADNMYDIWFRFSRMDPIEVGYITCLSGGMKTDDEVREAFNMVTTRGSRLMGGWHKGIQLGAPANLVVHEAVSLVDIFRNLPGRRLHIKNGNLVGGVEGNTWIAKR
jgi:cytosine deaminase